MSLVLIADSAGTPKDWVNFETAVCYYAKDKVVWEAGSPIREFLGGHNYLGEQSKITISSSLGQEAARISGQMSWQLVSPVITERVTRLQKKLRCIFSMFHTFLISSKR